MAGTDQQGFEVAPVRIGGGGGGDGAGGGRPGRGRLPIILIVVLALAVPAVALAGPRIEWRPEIDLSALVPTDPPASPEATRTPRPRITPAPTPTPLPDLTLNEGLRPVDPIPVHVSTFRLLDGGTGELGRTTNLRLDRDIIFAAPGGGWLCVCLDRRQGSTDETVAVSVRHLDRNMTETMRSDIATYRSEAPPPAQDYGVRIDIDRSRDGRFAYLAVGERAMAEWRLHVDTIDLWAGTLVGSTAIGVLTAPPAVEPEPSGNVQPGMLIDSYLNGPYIRRDPGGARAVIYGTVEIHDPTAGESRSERFGWFADVAADGAGVAGIAPLSATWHEQLTSCGWLTWLSGDELVAQCWEAFTGAPGSTINIRSFDLAGRIVADVAVAVSPNWGIGEPIYDRTSRTAWMWDPMDHVLHRVDLERGTADRIDPDPLNPQPVPAAPPATGDSPEWVEAGSLLQAWSGTSFAVERNGTRLYAAGFSQDPSAPDMRSWPGGSSGVWVFDVASFALVDHWPPAAAYSSIAIAPNGRWLMGVGQPAIDVAGNPTGWAASLTVHDTHDGRVAMQLGDLGQEQVLLMR